MLCEKSKCTGCQACRVICPKQAITMTETKEWKIVPYINEDLCVNCGLCEKTCPVLSKPTFKTPIETYAAWTMNEEDCKKCSSGGIATGLYRYILGIGGSVYGCDYDINLKPIIRRFNCMEDLDKFRRSKYVQSSTENSFLNVKMDLKEGKTVLYVGSPCQVDGLLHYLGEKYDNLYTVDFVCHGVSPYKYLQEYISAIVPNQKITNVVFRGEKDYFLTLYNGDEVVYQKNSWDDYYFSTFLEGVTFRDNCYECRYTRKERISDLTIGDFWGLNKDTLQEKYDGKVSVVLVNTQAGKKLISNISEIHFEKRTLNEAIKENRQLNYPMPVHDDRSVFLKNLDKGIYKALKRTKIGKKITKTNIKRNLFIYKIYKKVKK